MMQCCVCEVLGEVLLGGEGYFPLETMHGCKGTDCPFVMREELGLGAEEMD